MPATYNVMGWVWSGLGTPTTLVPVTIEDDDPELSPYFTDDFGENLTIGGTTYNNPRGGTYELTFTDSDGTVHTEDLLLWFVAPGTFVFVPQVNSEFDTGSVVNSLGGWQDWFTGFTWTDVLCLTAGTMIETVSGPKLIEALSVGEEIVTTDGTATLRWIGRTKLRTDVLAESQRLRPVRIVAGSLGQHLPTRDLLVSRQHRMMLRSKIAERMFASAEVLIPAIKLIQMPGIYVDETVEEVEYFHLLFDKHEVIFAEGAPTESLFTGPEALKSVDDEARAELLELFPELSELDYLPDPVRPIPSGKSLKNLLRRHMKNGRSLV